MTSQDRDAEIGGLVRRRSELRSERGDIYGYLTRASEPLQSLSVILRESEEIGVYENVIAINQGESNRIEDVIFEELSLRERILRLRVIEDELAELGNRLGLMGVD